MIDVKKILNRRFLTTGDVTADLSLQSYTVTSTLSSRIGDIYTLIHIKIAGIKFLLVQSTKMLPLLHLSENNNAQKASAYLRVAHG